MQWYGSLFRNIDDKPVVKNMRRRVNLKARTLALDLRPKTSYKEFTASVFFPTVCKYTYLRNLFTPSFITVNLIYSLYYANLSFIPSQVKFLHDFKSRSLLLFFATPNNYHNFYWLAFDLVFHVLTQIFFHKLKFRGKGYYVYKNYRNVVAFQFGYAHRVKIYIPFVSVKFTAKTVVFLFGTNKWDLMLASNWIFDRRPINIFTGRGVRFTRQIVYRKAGKISSYR